MPLELALFLGSALHRGQRNPPLPRLTRHAIPRKVRLDPAKAVLEGLVPEHLKMRFSLNLLDVLLNSSCQPFWSHPGTFLPDRLQQRGRSPWRSPSGVYLHYPDRWSHSAPHLAVLRGDR